MVEYQVEAAAYQGARPYQQDCVTRLSSADGDCVIGILSDGIGGGGHGHIASKVIVRSCVEQLKGQILTMQKDPSLTPGLLEEAARCANRQIAQISADTPKTRGMGATLVITAIVDDTLFWCSIGDSHVQIYRNGALERVNQNHSLATDLENLAKIGIIDTKTAASSGQRSSLTASVSGQELNMIDCSKTGVALIGVEAVLVASDGIETLTPAELAAHLEHSKDLNAAELCERIISDVEAKNNENQDNLSIILTIPWRGKRRRRAA